MTTKINNSRREFIRKTALLSAATSVGAPFALDLFKMNLAAAATTVTDYKALVCVYLAGGNDHNNMVLATDSASWNGYLAARNTGGAASIALMNADTTTRAIGITHTYNATNNKLGFSNAGRSFGLHPSMAPMQSLFTAGRAAIVANVGPLIEPILSKSAYSSAQKPKNLFSHSDQTAQWHTSQSTPSYGWGGRVAEQLIANNSSKPNFTCLSLSGNTVFLSGNNVNQYQINSSGSATAIQGITANSQLFGVTVDSSGNPLKNIITPSPSNFFEIDHAAVVQRAVDARSDLNAVMDATVTATGNTPAGSIPVPAAPTTGTGAYINPLTNLEGETNPLATQLRTVARIIAGRTMLSAKRQIFFVALGGFDTHDAQLNSHSILMARLAHAASYFNSALVSLPGGDMSSNVTLFTASDFGRTFTSNGDGTDHGWGSHHFVVGGAVNGGDIYGSFPDTVLGHNLDVGSGNLIPQISVDQYAATMAKWFGLNPAINGDLATAFPNLSAFTTQDLGFMKPA